MLVGYLYFYNPLWLVTNLLRRKSKLGLKPAGMQMVGMIGLMQTIRRTSGWTLRLMCRKIERLVRRPRSVIPMHDVRGGIATHEGGRAITSTERGRTIPLLVAS